MNKIHTVCLLALFIVSGCFSKVESNEQSQAMSLTKDELVQLCNIIGISENPEMNIHVLYKEYFNDSTLILDISEHAVTLNETLESDFKINGKSVYIYQLNDQKSPFFVPDAGYWSVLVQKKNGMNYYSRVELLSGSTIESEDLNLVEDEDFL